MSPCLVGYNWRCKLSLEKHTLVSIRLFLKMYKMWVVVTSKLENIRYNRLILPLLWLLKPGVFGNLEIHGLNRSVYWTRLSKTADPGSTIICLELEVDWKPGEEIVIGPTSFEPNDTEIRRIGKLKPLFLLLALQGCS